MTVRRSADVLDVLDRGIVIEAWAGVSLVGIRLVDVEARILVASCSTYVSLANPVAARAPGLAGAPVTALAAARPHTWICDRGCTFQRSRRWRQARVPCPSDKVSRCPVRSV